MCLIWNLYFSIWILSKKHWSPCQFQCSLPITPDVLESSVKIDRLTGPLSSSVIAKVSTSSNSTSVGLILYRFLVTVLLPSCGRRDHLRNIWTREYTRKYGEPAWAMLVTKLGYVVTMVICHVNRLPNQVSLFKISSVVTRYLPITVVRYQLKSNS